VSAPPVAVVRHGRAGDRQSWERDDRLRPLDGKGQRQAMALIDQLAPYRIERIVSSPYLRCIQTVVPLAVAARTAATLDDRLAEGSADRAVRELDRRDLSAVLVLRTGIPDPLLKRSPPLSA